MKAKALIMILGVVLGTAGCSFSISSPSTPTQADQVATVVAATMQSLTATPDESTPATPAEPSTQASGDSVSLENISFAIPAGLADGATTEKMTAVETNSGAPWEIAPTHARFTLTGYALQDRFHRPQVYVYRAEAYAQVNSAAAEQIDRLRKVLTGSALLAETLPRVPFFNAEAQIAAQIKLIPFQSGSGVRVLTQYAQYAAPINNHELFYHFQGLTSDGEYYVIAILPVTAPVLAQDEKPDAAIPEGGVPIPGDVGPNEVYYFSVTEKLNSLPPDQFTPSLTMLDALIQSIRVTPP